MISKQELKISTSAFLIELNSVSSKKDNLIIFF
jgi:hypothetical protein